MQFSAILLPWGEAMSALIKLNAEIEITNA
jgi:hypothetical protein